MADGGLCNVFGDAAAILNNQGHPLAAQLVGVVANACKQGDFKQIAKVRGCGCGGGNCDGCQMLGAACCRCVGDGVGTSATYSSIARMIQSQPTAVQNAVAAIQAAVPSAAFPSSAQIPGAGGAAPTGGPSRPACPPSQAECWQNLNAWEWDYTLSEAVARPLAAARCQEPFRATNAEFLVEHPTHPEYRLAAFEAYPKASCWSIKIASLTLGGDTQIDTVAAWTTMKVIQTDTKELIDAILPASAALSMVQVTPERCACDELRVCIPAGLPLILGFVVGAEDEFSVVFQVRHCECDPGYEFCGPYQELGDPWVELPTGLVIIPTAAPL